MKVSKTAVNAFTNIKGRMRSVPYLLGIELCRFPMVTACATLRGCETDKKPKTFTTLPLLCDFWLESTWQGKVLGW